MRVSGCVKHDEVQRNIQQHWAMHDSRCFKLLYQHAEGRGGGGGGGGGGLAMVLSLKANGLHVSYASIATISAFNSSNIHCQ